jgi:methionine-rich copper-binding protein CopC
MKTARRILVGLLLAGATVLATATPALAHTELKSSDPADGSSLGTAPTRVSLTFEEAVGIPATPISVAGPDGSSWQVGTATVDGATVSAPVTPAGPAGTYTVSYSVIADDGDTVTGKVSFSLTSAATPTTTAGPTSAAAATTAAVAVAAPTTAATTSAAGSDSGGGVPGWVWILIVVVVVVVGGFFLARSRRSSGS